MQGVTVPNPDALKFEVDGLLLAKEPLEFTSENAKYSPLAYQLFGLGYVTRVFVIGNFITVTKSPSAEVQWQEAQADIRLLIKRYLETNQPISRNLDSNLSSSEPIDETGKQLKAFLEERVSPATYTDGGEILFKSFENGILKVTLHGACYSCPFAPRTLKFGIEDIAKKEFPELISVTSDDVDWTQTQAE